MREQPQWDEHAAFMDSLVEDGFVVLGGPLGDGEKRFLLIVDAESEEETEARLADDPWTGAGFLRIAGVEPWQISVYQQAVAVPQRKQVGKGTEQDVIHESESQQNFVHRGAAA